MKDKKPDIKADIFDKEEEISLFEPLLVNEYSTQRKKLLDLVVELIAKSAAFRNRFPSAIQSSIATLVRGMNCYYSNLIEGHDTHPIDIERALQGNYSTDLKKRNLQLEAKAHIEVQQWIDNGGLKKSPYSQEAICKIHEKFCQLLPDDLLWVETIKSNEKIKVIPGQLRVDYVQVGNHIAISPGAVPRFLSRFESTYTKLNKLDAILALAATHHRFLWIHPFLDGNGRVARLMSHAATLQFLESGGMWSIARGLARNVVDYKAYLANCDLPRRNDLDGRGNLSEEALVEFTIFFLETCIDQVDFMEKLLEPSLFRHRVLSWVQEEIHLGHLSKQTIKILDIILSRGELPRAELPDVLLVSERHARRLIAPLVAEGILISDSPKSPYKLAFPVALVERWFPGLFPRESLS